MRCKLATTARAVVGLEARHTSRDTAGYAKEVLTTLTRVERAETADRSTCIKSPLIAVRCPPTSAPGFERFAVELIGASDWMEK